MNAREGGYNYGSVYVSLNKIKCGEKTSEQTVENQSDWFKARLIGWERQLSEEINQVNGTCSTGEVKRT